MTRWLVGAQPMTKKKTKAIADGETRIAQLTASIEEGTGKSA